MFVKSYVTLPAPDIKVRLASAVTTAEANLMWYKRNNQTIIQWIIKESATNTSIDANGSTTIGSLNVIFMILVALISHFVSCY